MLLGGLVVVNFVATVAIAPICGWAFLTILDHDRELASIKSNRFTATQGADLNTRLAKTEDTLANGIPPKWFVEKVQKLEDASLDQTKRLTRIELLLEQKRSP